MTTNKTKLMPVHEENEAVKVELGECNMTVVDLSVDSTTVSATPAILLGIYVNTVLSAQTCIIKDGATAKITLPASLAAGTEKDFRSAKFATSLVVDPNDAATGEIVVFWKSL